MNLQNKQDLVYETTNPSSNLLGVDSTLINRNDSSVENSVKISPSVLKKTKSEERFTLLDISSKNIDLSKIFSKISPKRYRKDTSMSLIKTKIIQPINKPVIEPRSVSMPSIRENLVSSKSIQSIKSFKSMKSSKKSDEENKPIQKSLSYMPIIKRRTVEDILSKWQNQDIKPFRRGINPFEVMK